MLGEVDVLAWRIATRSASGKAEYGTASISAASRQLCEDGWQRGSGQRWSGIHFAIPLSEMIWTLFCRDGIGGAVPVR